MMLEQLGSRRPRLNTSAVAWWLDDEHQDIDRSMKHQDIVQSFKVSAGPLMAFRKGAIDGKRPGQRQSSSD